MAWRLKDLSDEIARNVGATSFVLAVLVSLCLTGLLLTDLNVVSQILDRETELIDSGVNVYSVTAPNGIDGDRCHAAASIGSVRSAAAFTVRPETVRLATQPGSRANLVEGTPLTPQLIDPSLDSSPILSISQHLAASSGLSPGQLMVLADGLDPVAVGGVVRNEPRGVFLGHAVIATGLPGRMHRTCWIEFESSFASGSFGVVAALFGDDPELGISPLAQRGTTPPLQVALRERPTIGIAAILASVLAVTWGLKAWVARGDLALYRLMGTRSTELALMVLGEIVAITTISSAIALSLGALAVLALGLPPDALFLSYGNTVTAAGASAIGGFAATLALSTPGSAARRLKAG